MLFNRRVFRVLETHSKLAHAHLQRIERLADACTMPWRASLRDECQLSLTRRAAETARKFTLLNRTRLREWRTWRDEGGSRRKRVHRRVS